MFLEVSQLSIRYAGASRAAVEEVSFGLMPGEIGVLIGPSGCGKTTLLRAVAGLEPVAGGTISLSGDIVSSKDRQVAPEDRRIGMVFQDYALFPHLDVGRNIAFGIQSMPREERSRRVAEVLELVGLAGSEKRYPHELSGGQQQRVALARALAPNPQLMLLDEPFSNLDVDLRERLAHEVRGILKEAKATALFVTHDQLEAFAIGDVVGVMNQGKLDQWAGAYDLYHRPATRFVADFIGHGVFTPATVSRDGGRVVASTSIGELSDAATHHEVQSNDDAKGFDVLLRADDIVHDDSASTTAEIIRKSFRGSEYLYTLKLDSGDVVLALVSSHHDHAIGERIGIRPSVDHLVLFPRD